MKKTILALILIVALVLAVLPISVGAQANVDNSLRLRRPLKDEVVITPDGCENLIHTAGYVNIFGHLTDLGDGEQLLVFHANPQHAVLEGMETGNIYHGVGNTQEIVRLIGPGQTVKGTYIFMQVPYVGYQAVVQYTVNANGEVTAEIDHYIEPGFNCG